MDAASIRTRLEEARALEKQLTFDITEKRSQLESDYYFSGAVDFKDVYLPKEIRDDRDVFLKFILEAPEKTILKISEVTVDRPIPERTRGSVTCSACGEGVNKQRVRNTDGRTFCIPCAKSGE